MDKDFYKKLIGITIPIVLQNFVASSINMLDTLMIGSLGEIELASLGIANQFYFIFSLAIFGISAGCGVFIAQLWGKKDEKNIKKVLGLGLISGLIITGIFTFLGMVIPEKIIGIFNRDLEVITKGSEYLVIVAISYIFTTITFNYAAALRSIGKPMLPMWASFCALVVNGGLNYLLIFGGLGIEPMGVKGAALATVIARTVEVLVILIGVKFNVETLKGKVQEFLGGSKELKNGVFKTSLPIVLNDVCWGVGNAVYGIVFGRIGTGATAAVQIDTTILNFFMIIIYGLANGAVVIVGNEIGAGREKQGILYGNRISRISIGVGIFLAIILGSTAQFMVNGFNISQSVKMDALKILYIYALLLIPRVYTIILIVGILRGGGDNKYGSLVQGFTLWCVGIPLAFIGAFYLKLPVYYVVGLTAVEEILKCIILSRRYKSNKWIHNMVEDIKENDFVVA